MLLALQQNLLLGTTTLVTVPDVVGQTQAAGTSALQAVLFVVAVQTAYSSVVPAGTIISQSPAGGIDYPQGGTVTITVSLGDAPPVQSQDFTGGFIYAFELEQARRRVERKRRAELEEESERIEEETTREIAKLLREQEAKDARRAELQRLSALVAASRVNEAALSERAEKALRIAAVKQTTWALFQLERELQAQQEEEFILSALVINLYD